MTTPKVLMVGWDGVRDDVVRRLGPAALSNLAEAGRWWTTSVRGPTITAPGWATVLTGVWPELHQVMNNDDEHHLLHRYPDVLTRTTCSENGYSTYAATSGLIWGTSFGPGPILGPGVTRLDWLDRRQYPGSFSDTDPLIADSAVDQLRTTSAALSFVYFGETDQVAHDSGVGSEYESAILRQDRRLARLLDAIRGRSTFADESWLVIVTTDHGHLDNGGHGGDSWQERQSFVVAGMLTAEKPRGWAERAEIVDLAPTALDHLRVEPSVRWPSQGQSLIVA